MTKKLTSSEKFEIAKCLKDGKTTERKLIEKFSTSKGAIFRIKKNLDNILNIWDERKCDKQKSEETMKENPFNKYKELNGLVLEVFNRLRSSSIPLNGTIKNLD
jgi:hypothetical protein